MKSDLINIFLGLVEGFTLIISPCILPILPIVLASSLAGSRKRPVGIITGFTVIFALFAFFSRKIVQYSGIDLNVIRHLSYVILFLLGTIMISSYLTNKFADFTQKLVTLGSKFSIVGHSEGGFLSGLFLGGVVAIVWTPCAGPILAAVIVQIVIQQTTLASFFTLLAFALGAAVPMYVIALYGIKIMDNFSFFKTRATLFRKVLGVIIMASVGYMIYQENGFISSSEAQSAVKTSVSLQQGLWRPYAAPQISGIDAWVNSAPLSISDVKGKVVLIDFWTYSCINCVRTVPYLKNWYSKYHNKGLEIIGVHAPEFDFEKNVDNVRRAVQRYGIDYPVALDNQFTTWRNFDNHNWPAQYLISKQGNVVYQHIGEGDDDVIENNIRFLLGIDAPAVLATSENRPLFDTQTPETYLGYERADSDLSPALTHDEVASYVFPQQLGSNAWALQGAWKVNEVKIVSAEANAALKIRFNARKVFIVMGSNTSKPIRVNVLLNGEHIIADKGTDVKNSSILVDKHTIYEVLAMKQFANGILQVIATEPGLEAYTFTFGN